MTELAEILLKIDSLKVELDAILPLKREDEERLWKKFRLEWNYNSNHIEGNTLTYGQTELLLIFDKTTGDKDMREYEEMKAHDVAINLVKEYARDFSRELSESDIRELNKIILVRPFWADAQTSEGQPTRKLIQPGEYKKQPNSVRLQSGEMFHYASPEETPAKMKELIDWYKTAISENILHPVVIAAIFHYKFVCIHPFDDSNGRTSRLLMNYVLLRNNFPPVIIKSKDKKGYLNALNKADVGDLNSFISYIAEELIWSLDLNINAAKGKNIEEDDDLYKTIDIWKKTLSRSDLERPIKSIETIENFFLKSIIPVFESYAIKHKEFDFIFLENTFSIFINGIGKSITNVDDLKSYFVERLNLIKSNPHNFLTDDLKVTLNCQHRHLKIQTKSNNYFTSDLEYNFKPLEIEFRYKIKIQQVLTRKYLYSEIIPEKERNELVK